MKNNISLNIPSSDLQRWRRVLLSWYADHQRSLPWRNIQNPYHIWVSEIILQQTRVIQGLDYYHRFLAAFPTVEDLAAAPEEEVLRIWQGLGYYSRARNMQVAAQQMVAEGIPNTFEGWRKLKGVGDYTAAAVCSFAFGLPTATVDGNVYRVLSRYFDIDMPIDTGPAKRYFASLAQLLLDTNSPAAYNQALMDFGAIQCVPKNPHCDECPFLYSCSSFAAGTIESRPTKHKRIVPTSRYFTYLIFLRENKIWLHRRPAGDIWQGLYQPFLIETSAHAEWSDISSKIQLSQKITVKPLVTDLRHVLTHRILHADAYILHIPASCSIPNLSEDGIWVAQEKWKDFAVPRLVEKILTKL